MNDAPPSSLMDSTKSLKVKTTKGGVRARSLAYNTLGGRGACWNSKMGLGRLTSTSLIHTNLHKLNNKLVNAQIVVALRCMDEPRTITDSQDSPRPGLGRNHHLPPYSILCACPQDEHSHVILSQDSQVGIPKFPHLGLP